MHYLNSTQRFTFKFRTHDLHNMPMVHVILCYILVCLQKGLTTFNVTSLDPSHSIVQQPPVRVRRLQPQQGQTLQRPAQTQPVHPGVAGGHVRGSHTVQEA